MQSITYPCSMPDDRRLGPAKDGASSFYSDVYGEWVGNVGWRRKSGLRLRGPAPAAIGAASKRKRGKLREAAFGQPLGPLNLNQRQRDVSQCRHIKSETWQRKS